jgi:glucosamine kinase
METLGIDAGGTKTVCLLADEAGTVIDEARGPAANLQAIGELEVEKVLHDVIEQVMGERHTWPGAICIGMAGVDRPEDEATILSVLHRINRRARALVVNDALIALEAGAPDSPGVVLLAGTGSIAYGRDGRNRAARSGGWGHVLADEGSGYWLGREALRAVMRAVDHRGPATAITGRVLAHYKITRPQDLIREIYERDMRPQAIAALAEVVDASALAGDAVAIDISESGAIELVRAAVSVVERLDLPRGPIVLGGGILTSLSRYGGVVRRHLARLLPEAAIRSLDVEPAIGALRLAVKLTKGDVRLPSYIDAGE